MAAVISRQLTSKQNSTTGMSNPHLSKEQQSKLLAAPAGRVTSNTSNASHASSSSSVSSRAAHPHSNQNANSRNEAPIKGAGPGPPGGASPHSKTEGAQVKGASVIRQSAQPSGNLDPKPVSSAANRLSGVSGGSLNVESSRSTTPNPSTTPLLSSTPVPAVSGGENSGPQTGNPLLKAANNNKINIGPDVGLRERNGGRNTDGDAEGGEREDDDEDEPSKLVTRIVAGVAIALVVAAVVLVAIMLKLSAHLDSKGIRADLRVI